MNFKPLIWVEGTIGSGKTTLCERIGKLLQLRVIKEPVEDNYYLEPFYENPKRYAFGFQIFMLHRRFAMQQLASYECTPAGTAKGAILDRSLSGDRVFAKLHLDAGNIDPLDWRTYEECYMIMARSLLPPTLLVYIDAQPETAWERMQRRGRRAEAAVPLEYLQKLQKGYEALLQEAERGLLPWAHAVRVCRIPWDPDTLTDDQWQRTAQTIWNACQR